MKRELQTGNVHAMPVSRIYSPSTPNRLCLDALAVAQLHANARRTASVARHRERHVSSPKRLQLRLKNRSRKRGNLKTAKNQKRSAKETFQKRLAAANELHQDARAAVRCCKPCSACDVLLCPAWRTSAGAGSAALPGVRGRPAHGGGWGGRQQPFLHAGGGQCGRACKRQVLPRHAACRCGVPRCCTHTCKSAHTHFCMHLFTYRPCGVLVSSWNRSSYGRLRRRARLTGTHANIHHAPCGATRCHT
jgi:hypothetical protein